MLGFFRLSCLLEFGAATLSSLIGAACPHCPLSSRILSSVSPPGLHSSYILSQYQRASPLPIPPTCPCCWSWISLAWPVLLLIICQLGPHGIDCQGEKFSSLSSVVELYVKAYPLTEGLCRRKKQGSATAFQGRITFKLCGRFLISPSKALETFQRRLKTNLRITNTAFW